MVSDDPDSCIPAPLKDFIFDLHDSVTLSHIPSEQNSLYHGLFRELTAKYFAQGPWPSADSISSECNNDPLFLALYEELIQRHLHSITRPSARDRVDGWHVYRRLFDLMLVEKDWFILPQWSFDILHEFLYQFQGFCQFRTGVYANARKYSISEGQSSEATKTMPNHMKETLEILHQNRDAWAVETVLFYLHRLVSVGKKSEYSVYQYFGIFGSITLSRLECLLGDYTSSLDALKPIYSGRMVTKARGDDDDSKSQTVEDLVNAVFSARLNMAYHAGVSYLMLRRYKDASRVLGGICATMQRGFKAGIYKKLPGCDQFAKLFDRMIALLAILTHVCPSTGLVEESVAKQVREKHGNQLSKIEAGEEGYEDLFIFSCPKFVSPAVHDYEVALEGKAALDLSGQDAYQLQVRHFMNEMATQQTFRKLQSYMKLYTSISVEKLGRLVLEEEFMSLLVSYKHKMRQIESAIGEDAKLGFSLDGKIGSLMDAHYYISDGIIHVDVGETPNRFENFFISKIFQCNEIIKDIKKVSVEV